MNFMEIKEISQGVFKIDRRLATANLVKGEKVYGEDIRRIGGVEYRLWDPYRSKLAAAILKGLKNLQIKKGSNVLYLGAATGTTCSHISDIVGDSGSVYCVENSEESMRSLLNLCKSRENIFPIFSDARNPEEYTGSAEKVDVIYQDVSSRDQSLILKINGKVLRSNAAAYVAIKSQSISVSKNPREVYRQFMREVSGDFTLSESMTLEPFDMKHLFAFFRKR